MTGITGGCLCGQVRFRASGAPIRGHLCHCRDCQRFTGSAFAAGMMFPGAAVSFDGERAVFAVTGRSGHDVLRHFCPRCGSGVAVTGAVLRDIVVLQAGTFDDSTQYRPTTEIFTESAMPWVHAPGGFPTVRGS